jgi:hypothetical protein
MAQKTKQELEFEQLMTAKRNSVIDAELNARYWKAQWEVKHYTILEAGLREEYGKLLEAKQDILDKVDAAVEESIAKNTTEIADPKTGE